MIEMNFNEGVIRATPVVAAAGADVASKFAGLTMSDWFYAAAIIYSLAQTGLLIYRTVAAVRANKKE